MFRCLKGYDSSRLEFTKEQEEQKKLELMRKYIGSIPFPSDLLSKKYPYIARRVVAVIASSRLSTDNNNNKT